MSPLPTVGFATASNVTAQINTSSKTAVVTNLDITTTADLDYYKFTAPAGSSSTLKLTVQSTGLSQLAPKVWVYDSAQKQLATASGAGQYGTTLSLNVSGISAGKTYYVKVAGADTTAFGTGKYAFTLNMGSGASPIVPKPNTTTANGSPLHSGGGLADRTLLGVLLNPLGLLLGGIFRGYGDVLTVNGHEHGSGHDHGEESNHHADGDARHGNQATWNALDWGFGFQRSFSLTHSHEEVSSSGPGRNSSGHRWFDLVAAYFADADWADGLWAR